MTVVLTRDHCLFKAKNDDKLGLHNAAQFFLCVHK